MFIIYQIGISLLILLSPIIFTYRIFKNKEDIKRLGEKFSFPSRYRHNGKLIWFHGASVGEIMSIIPLIKYYENKKYVKQILVTSTTVSSSKILKKFNFKKTTHQFFPIDHNFFTNKFLKYWKPSVAIFIESEIWPSMFKNLKKNNIPLLLLNARLTKKTFKKWMNIRNFAKSVFNLITISYPQNLETTSYLKKLEVKKIKQIGNLKFIENKENETSKIDRKLKKMLKNKKIWVASSTHKYEEVFCAKAHIELKKKIRNLITIIIPRHVHRVAEIISEIEGLNLKIITHSSKLKNFKNLDIYLVDTFGETIKFHKIGCSVFLGGSIIKRGGQNPLEAARYGAKILHGPNIDNFKDVYKQLNLFNISKKINTPKKLANSISFKRNKNIGNKIKKIGEKILNQTIKELDNLINNDFKKT